MPVLTVAVAWLWVHRLRPVAVALAINAALAVTATIMLKKVSQQIGGAFFDQPWRLTTGAPSGHAAVSMVVYGSIGALFALRGRGITRIAGLALALALLAAVDITRVTLGYHSPGDVVCGLVVGTIFVCLTIFAASASRASWPPMPMLLLGLVLAATIAHLTGLRFDSNAVL